MELFTLYSAEELSNKVNAISYVHAKSIAYNKKKNGKHSTEPSLYLHVHDDGLVYFLSIGTFAVHAVSVKAITCINNYSSMTFNVDLKAIKTLHKWLSFLKDTNDDTLFSVKAEVVEGSRSDIIFSPVKAQTNSSISMPVKDWNADISYMNVVYAIGDKYPEKLVKENAKSASMRCSQFSTELLSHTLDFIKKASISCREPFLNDITEFCSARESDLYFFHSAANPDVYSENYTLDTVHYGVFSIIMPLAKV